MDGVSQETIQKQIDVINSEMKEESDTLKHVRLQERITRLTGNVAVIYVGGESELEINEKKDLYEDALFATKVETIRNGQA